MTPKITEESSLISVIITCHNHGQYLPIAIDSVLKQDYGQVEIVVVDDGSTDNTKEIAESFSNVKYVYQHNQGLSAARNTGIDHSTGAYLVFLDADDWLLTGALSTNLKYLKQNREAAFVSGGFVRVNKQKQAVNRTRAVTENHYCHLLQGNYIQMHAAVLYHRWIFDEFRYDTSLDACEDYDIYLHVARKYPIFHHKNLIAAYYIHDQNMSNNVPRMLRTALQVLNKQRKYLANEEEEKCLQTGIDTYKQVYCGGLYYNLLHTPDAENQAGKAAEVQALRKHDKALYLRYLILKKIPLKPVKPFIKKNAPRFILQGLRKAGIYKDPSPPLNRINFGDFKRTTPFADDFGYGRGGPVDRYYIEKFLQQQSDNIKGRVLEIGDNEYTLQFGESKVTQSDILHVNENNPKATFFGDLSDAPHLPSDSFDCIVLTQTLHLIYSYQDALKTCYRILKPGGTLLLTVPGISQIDQGEWKDSWFWSFTDNSMARLMSEIFPVENVDIRTYGNVFVAAAFLYGVGLPEIEKEQLNFNDPHYQVIISVSAVKPE